MTLPLVNRLSRRKLAHTKSAVVAVLALAFGCIALGPAPVGADTQGDASNSMWLFWTATGDDADAGRAYRYDLRYSTSTVGSNIAAWWDAARSATRLPLPSPPGRTDSVAVSGLAPETTYQFMIRVIDEAGNLSGFSNVASGTTAAEISPPPPGPQLTESGTSGGATIHAYPNPSTGPVQIVIDVTASSSQPVRIRLYDLSGRCVADIANGSVSPGNTTVTWPRTTRNGHHVAPGYYEAIGFVGDTKVRERLILLP